VRQGCHVTAVDRDAQALAAWPTWPPWPAHCCADIENGDWPLTGQAFDAVVVTNYLWRPLWPQILASLAPGGVLIYETFAHGNATVGKPSRPDFLLQNGELLQVCSGLRIVAYEDGFLAPPTGLCSAFARSGRHLPWPDPPPRHLLRATG
jgi:SAM-dependent methyltransferase